MRVCSQVSVRLSRRWNRLFQGLSAVRRATYSTPLRKVTRLLRQKALSTAKAGQTLLRPHKTAMPALCPAARSTSAESAARGRLVYPQTPGRLQTSPLHQIRARETCVDHCLYICSTVTSDNPSVHVMQRLESIELSMSSTDSGGVRTLLTDSQRLAYKVDSAALCTPCYASTFTPSCCIGVCADGP